MTEKSAAHLQRTPSSEDPPTEDTVSVDGTGETVSVESQAQSADTWTPTSEWVCPYFSVQSGTADLHHLSFVGSRMEAETSTANYHETSPGVGTSGGEDLH